MVGASQSPLAQRLGEETPVDSCAHSAATGGLRYSGEMCTVTELLCWCMIHAESAIQCTFYLDLIELSFESRGEKGRAVVELELYREICQAFFFGVGRSVCHSSSVCWLMQKIFICGCFTLFGALRHLWCFQNLVRRFSRVVTLTNIATEPTNQQCGGILARVRGICNRSCCWICPFYVGGSVEVGRRRCTNGTQHTMRNSHGLDMTIPTKPLAEHDGRKHVLWNTALT